MKKGIVKNISLIWVVTLLTLAQTFAQKVTIDGSIDKATASTKIKLVSLVPGKGVSTADSILAPKGKFNFTFAIPNDGGLYQLIVEDKKQLLILENNDKVVVKIDAARNFDVSGSKNMTYFKKLNTISEAMKVKAAGLEKDFQAAVASKNEAKQRELQQTYQTESATTVNAIKALFPEMGTSLVCIYATNFLDPEQEAPFFESVAGKFKAKGTKIPEVLNFIKTVEQVKGTNVGGIAPEIEEKTPEGNTLKLSDLKGKYVLLDFWASWCGPCRRENPNVVKAYNKYKGENFEILSISLDQDKAAWLKAIEKDGMVWKHVSDLGSWNSRPARTYSVQSIPATFLLDKEGKIIAKNLRGSELEAKLQELFPGK